MSVRTALPDFRGLRVLVLSPTPTSPLSHGNRKRVHRVCRDIVEAGGEVVFALYASELEWRHHVPETDLRQMEADWGRVHVIPPSVPLHAHPRNGSHHELDEWWDPMLDAHLKHLFQSYVFDVVIVNYTWLSRALTLAPRNVLKVLDTHDVFSGRKELLSRQGIAPEFFYLATPEEERVALERADLVWAIKEEEADFFRSLTSTEVLVMPYMEPPAILEAQPKGHPGVLQVGLVGADNNVNRVNALRFLDVLRRDVARYFAPLELKIVGSVCDGLRLRADSLVTPLGRVDSLEAFYAQIDVAVVPMDFSTGLKIKTGEALGFGVATVSTAHAFEGYRVHHPLQALSDIEAVVRALVKLSFEPERLESLRQAARASAETTRKTAQQTLAQTAIAARDRFCSLVVIDADQLCDDGLRAAGTDDLLTWLGWAGPSEVFVASGTLKPGRKLKKLGYVNRRLLLDPAVECTALAGDEGLRLEQVSLSQVLELKNPDIVFVDTVLRQDQAAVLRRRKVPVVARVPQIMTSSAGGATTLDRVVSEIRPNFALMPTPTQAALEALPKVDGAVIGNAMLKRLDKRGGGQSRVPLAWNNPQALILVDEVTPAALQIGQLLAEDGWNVVLADGSETTGALPSPRDRQGQLRQASMGWVCEALFLADHLPRVALDLSESAGWRQFALEQLVRGGVPLLRLRPPGARLLPCGDDLLTPSGPWQAVRLMQRLLHEESDLLEQIRRVYPGPDARSEEDGWAVIWPLLMQLKRKEEPGLHQEIAFT